MPVRSVVVSLPPVPSKWTWTLLLALAAGDEASPADPSPGSWSRFRGPASQGVTDDDAAYPASLDLTGGVRWRADVPPGHSSPCIEAGRIFITGVTDEGLVVACLDQHDGALRWQRVFAATTREKTHELHDVASPTPACDGERVYVSFGSLGLICLDLDGAEVWRRELPVARNTFGTAASPTLAGHRLIFVRDQIEGSFLEVLDGRTGAVEWRKDRADFGSAWSTPVVRHAGDVEELLVYGVGWLTAYELNTGESRWAIPGLADEPCTTPVLAGDLVVVTSYNMNTNPEVVGLPEFDTLLAAHDRDGDGRLSREEAAENRSVLSRHDADGRGRPSAAHLLSVPRRRRGRPDRRRRVAQDRGVGRRLQASERPWWRSASMTTGRRSRGSTPAVSPSAPLRCITKGGSSWSRTAAS